MERVFRNGCAAALCIGLAGCATTPASRPDPICPAIRDFANATHDAAAHVVELTTTWFPPGGSVGPRAECQDAGDAPGRALCSVLVQHASREFAAANIERTLACVSKAGHIDGLPIYAVHSLSGEVSSFEMPGVDGDVELTVFFDTRKNGKPATLSIESKRAATPR